MLSVSHQNLVLSAIAIQKSFGRLEAGPTVEPASSRREKTFLDKYTLNGLKRNFFDRITGLTRIIFRSSPYIYRAFSPVKK